MLRATFLGHQGWFLETARRRLLVDPLLTGSFGHGGVVGVVHPPRALDLQAMPPVDAVLLTHEHEDHFDIPSLHRLDRAIPVFLSSRSSVAARRTLRSMGFRVGSLRAGEALDLDGARVLCLSGDHVAYTQGDEWDALPYLVSDPGDGANFFSAVDLLPTDALIEAVAAQAPRPGLVCHTNNASTLGFASTRFIPATSDTLAFAADTITLHARLSRAWGRPAATLFCGGGFAFEGDRAPLNRRTFTADSSRVAAALRTLCPGERFIAPSPGQTVRCEGGEALLEAEFAPWLRPLPEDRWPERAFDPSPFHLERFSPASGTTSLSAEDFAHLVEALEGFAAHLYGQGTFRGLHSLGGARIEGRLPTVALVCRVDDGAITLAYSPTERRFNAVRCERPAEEYLAGVECWASDLLGLLRTEFSAAALLFGRYRSWNALPERFALHIVGELMHYAHPLRQPAGYEALYRRLLAREPPRPLRVRWSGSALPPALFDAAPG
jgi:hypothetical protein